MKLVCIAAVLSTISLGCQNKDVGSDANRPGPHADSNRLAQAAIPSLEASSREESLADFSIRFNRMVETGDLTGLQELLDTAAHCGFGNEKGVTGCLEGFPFSPDDPNSGAFLAALAEVAKWGFGIYASDGDTTAFLPAFLPFGKENPCDVETGANCMYFPGQTFFLYSEPDTSKPPETVPGMSYGTSLELRGCKKYPFLASEADCTWQKVTTMDGKMGWVRNDEVRWLHELVVLVHRKGNNWKITGLTSGGE